MTLIIEFISSIVVSAGVPTAFFFSFRLHKGSFTSSGFTSSGFDVDRVVIDKRNVFFLILSILGIVPLFLSIN